jgi:ribosomal protein S18 acetylase RimI-like enzyme
VLLCEGDAPRGTPLGALLLSRAAPADTLELVYLGLTPAARGRGLGDVMMRRALASVAADGATRLSLAVDSDNVPALKLYYRHGMQRVGAKLALMRQLQPSAQR